LVKERSVLHVTSENEGRASATRIPRAQGVCIPNGIDLPPLPRQRLWRPDGCLRVLFIGRLDPIKGIENLLQAVSALPTIKVRLAICGSGAKNYEDSLRRLVAQLHLDEHVRFLGHVDGEAKTRIFFDSDVCVLPSFSENFGMAVAEALAHGVPVIASRGTPWAGLEERRCGLWVDNSPTGISNAITAISGANLEEMGCRGRQWMERDYGWSAIADRMSELYENMVHAR
jgi:glycosyltransferase involved in cell wall biosynthesis